MPKAATSKVAAKRKEYNAVKRLYQTAGKKARGKPKTSIPYKEYKTVKREYKRIGAQLGKMTGLKKRR